MSDYIVVWDVNCDFKGSWRGNKRFCLKNQRWMEFEDCFRCLEGGKDV